MCKQIHLHHRVSRQFAALENQNNTPAIASMKAKRIIKNLEVGQPASTPGLLRPKPDKRLKNCLKFNLGSGFRLICIRKKEAIHVMFFGDHDSCDTWLTQHGRKKPHRKGQRRVVARTEIPVPATKRVTGQNENFGNEAGLYDISQKDLRRVFKGLTGES